MQPGRLPLPAAAPPAPQHNNTTTQQPHRTPAAAHTSSRRRASCSGAGDSATVCSSSSRGSARNGPMPPPSPPARASTRTTAARSRRLSLVSAAEMRRRKEAPQGSMAVARAARYLRSAGGACAGAGRGAGDGEGLAEGSCSGNLYLERAALAALPGAHTAMRHRGAALHSTAILFRQTQKAVSSCQPPHPPTHTCVALRPAAGHSGGNRSPSRQAEANISAGVCGNSKTAAGCS